MNWHHDDGCGAQKSVRIDSIEVHRDKNGRAVQVEWMTCDHCGDLWPLSQEIDE